MEIMDMSEDNKLEEKTPSILALMQQLEEKERIIRELSIKIELQTTELANYEMSHSWRITRPLRKLTAKFRSVKNG